MFSQLISNFINTQTNTREAFVQTGQEIPSDQKFTRKLTFSGVLLDKEPLTVTITLEKRHFLPMIVEYHDYVNCGKFYPHSYYFEDKVHMVNFIDTLKNIKKESYTEVICLLRKAIFNAFTNAEHVKFTKDIEIKYVNDYEYVSALLRGNNVLKSFDISEANADFDHNKVEQLYEIYLCKNLEYVNISSKFNYIGAYKNVVKKEMMNFRETLTFFTKFKQTFNTIRNFHAAGYELNMDDYDLIVSAFNLELEAFSGEEKKLMSDEFDKIDKSGQICTIAELTKEKCQMLDSRSNNFLDMVQYKTVSQSSYDTEKSVKKIAEYKGRKFNPKKLPQELMCNVKYHNITSVYYTTETKSQSYYKTINFDSRDTSDDDSDQDSYSD